MKIELFWFGLVSFGWGRTKKEQTFKLVFVQTEYSQIWKSKRNIM